MCYFKNVNSLDVKTIFDHFYSMVKFIRSFVYDVYFPCHMMLRAPVFCFWLCTVFIVTSTQWLIQDLNLRGRDFVNEVTAVIESAEC